MIETDRPSRPRNRQDVCDFQVIGELKDDPEHLLLLGDDGRCYAMDALTGDLTVLEPDDSWALDAIENASLRLEVPRAFIA